MTISQRDRERRREYRMANDVHPYRHVVPQIPKIDESQLSRLLAEIPREDTRSLTGRLCGDPNPTDRRRRPATAAGG